VTSARLTIFKTLASGTSAELTLTTSRTSSTETLAKQTLAPQEESGKEAKFKESWRKEPSQKNSVRKTERKCARIEHGLSSTVYGCLVAHTG